MTTKVENYVNNKIETNIVEALGNEAQPLLDYTCQGIAKETLTLSVNQGLRNPESV